VERRRQPRLASSRGRKRKSQRAREREGWHGGERRVKKDFYENRSLGRSPPLRTRGPGFFTWASFAPPLRELSRSVPEDRLGPVIGVRSVLPDWRPVAGFRTSFLARRRPIPSRRAVALPAPPASPRPRRRSGGKSECPGQFQRRSHRLHHVPEAVLAVLSSAECRRECAIRLGRSKSEIR